MCLLRSYCTPLRPKLSRKVNFSFELLIHKFFFVSLLSKEILPTSTTAPLKHIPMLQLMKKKVVDMNLCILNLPILKKYMKMKELSNRHFLYTHSQFYLTFWKWKFGYSKLPGIHDVLSYVSFVITFW